MARKVPLIPIGSVFGRLTVVGHTALRGRQACKCLCECGTSRIVASSDLRFNRTRSCGCYNQEQRLVSSKTHGDSKTRLFRIWALMIERCKPGNVSAKNYGDRGIRVCDDWQNYEAFRAWALASGYNDELTIERIDVDGDYTAENCTWIPRARQVFNRRVTVRVALNGETKCLSEWCREKGVKYHTAITRYNRGWTTEHLFDPPIPHEVSFRGSEYIRRHFHG